MIVTYYIRIYQPPHYWYFGLDNSLLIGTRGIEEIILWIVRCSWHAWPCSTDPWATKQLVIIKKVSWYCQYFLQWIEKQINPSWENPFDFNLYPISIIGFKWKCLFCFCFSSSYSISGCYYLFYYCYCFSSPNVTLCMASTELWQFYSR